MRKTFLFFLLLASLFVNAQREKFWGDPHVVEKFATEALADPAYAGLSKQLMALSNSATRNNSNAAAVRNLFSKNSSLLKELYTRAGLEAPKAMNAQRKNYEAKNVAYKKMIPWAKLQIHSSVNIKTETPPFDATARISDEAGMNNMYPDTTASQFSNAVVRMVYRSLPPSHTKRKTGQYLQGYKQSFTVPANPEIVAAEVRIEYSYLYTGWDTYGAIVGMDLAFAVNDQLNGPDIEALPVYPSPYGDNANYRWRKAATLFATDTLTADFDEFHSEATSGVYTFGGYVTPGAVVNIVPIMGFQKGTKRGINGSYHYAEFVLKKISVTYYKAAGNN